MNSNNNESPNNKDNIDISFNFPLNIDNSSNKIKSENSPLHDPLKKSVEDIINDMCNEFDRILKITSEKKYILDQSYNNLLLEDKKDNSPINPFDDNIRYNTFNNGIMNKNSIFDKPVAKGNRKRSLSYYLKSYDDRQGSRYKNQKYKTNQYLSGSLKDIDSKYENFNLKNHFYNSKRPPSPLSIPKPIIIEKKKIDIKVSLKTIGDLIKLADDYPLSPTIEYNIDMRAIHLIKPDMVRLNDMIGMDNLKENILDQILYFIQKLHIHKNENSNNEFMHTVIYGPPGTGKTETAHIIGGIYSKLGILKKNVFKKVTRADLIAGYLGQTALKTQEVIKSALGGVLFIDEAYALGNKEKKDSFAKECIDTLCEALSNHKHELMVIIAGYEEDLKKCFFSYNQGLDSRFIWRFKIDDYNPTELQQIFNKKVKDCGWLIGKTPTTWFKKNKDYFKYFGRDMETLLAKVKIAHSRRVFCLDEKEKRNINNEDIEKGFELYLKNEEVKSRVEEHMNPLVNMYI